MNRKTEINRTASVALDNISNVKDIFELEYIDRDEFKILPANLNDGREIIRIFCNDKYYDSESTYNINIDNLIKDNISRQNNHFYFLWCKLNLNENKIDSFFLTKQPKAVATSITDGSKNNIATINLADSIENYAWQFTIGARVVVWTSESTVGSENNNLGVITEIASRTQIKVKLDNDTNYGSSTVSGTATIVQLDKFYPNKIFFDKAELISENYKLLSGCLRINSSGNLEQFTYDDGNIYIDEKTLIYLSSNPTSAYNRNFYVFEYIPPTANYLAGHVRYDMSYPATTGFNYCVVENWFRDKNYLSLYHELVGLAPYSQAYYWFQTNYHFGLKESIMLYREAISTAGPSIALRIMRIYFYREVI